MIKIDALKWAAENPGKKIKEKGWGSMSFIYYDEKRNLFKDRDYCPYDDLRDIMKDNWEMVEEQEENPTTEIELRLRRLEEQIKDLTNIVILNENYRSLSWNTGPCNK